MPRRISSSAWLCVPTVPTWARYEESHPAAWRPIVCGKIFPCFSTFSPSMFLLKGIVSKKKKTFFCLCTNFPKILYFGVKLDSQTFFVRVFFFYLELSFCETRQFSVFTCDFFINFRTLEVINRVCLNKNKDSFRVLAAFRTKLRSAIFKFFFRFLLVCNFLSLTQNTQKT